MFPDPKREGLLVVVSGPSGCGKTTLCRNATAVEPVYYTVSCTTRAMRPGEENGRDYFFLSEEEFISKVSAGDFLEHATVYGRHYGTLKSEVLPALQAGMEVMMNLDIQGAAQLRNCSDPLIRRALVDVIIMPAGVEELRGRLAGRRSETEEQLALRLANAMAEMRHWREYGFTLISHTREADLAALRSILHSERRRSTRLLAPESFPA